MSCWLGAAFVALPLLGDPVSFNKVSNTGSSDGSQTSSQVASRNYRGNVYHIVLDDYQSAAYQYLLAQVPEMGQLPFTYYPDFRSNAALTYFSMAQLFTGDFYTPSMSPERWHNAAFQTGMLNYLASSGVQLDLYPHFPEYCYAGVSSCKATLDLKTELMGGGQVRKTALDLWFLKLIPTSLKRELNAWFAPPDEGGSDSAGFSNWDYGFSVSDALSPSSLPGDRDEEPYFSVQQFMRFLDDEGSRPATGRYIFMHLMLPHPPFVLDQECNYVGRWKKAYGVETPEKAQARYFNQVQCADKVIAMLWKKLESLGRLDNSLLIVQADHGYYWHPADLGALYHYEPMDVSVPHIENRGDDSSTWPSEVIETRSSSLLLIKSPGQSAASRSDKLVQIIDIAPTILRYFNVDPGSMRGIPIQEMPESLDRDRLFFAANFIPSEDNPRVISRYRYVDGKWKFEKDIVTLTDADQLFTLGSK